MTDPLLQTQPTPPEEAHYLRAVTDMAQRCAVVSQDAIYSDNGIKLVEKGARIDSRLYDRLVQHKLREPIDAHLSVENAVDATFLASAARQLMQSSPLVRLLTQALSAPERLVAPLRSMPLIEPIAFKLTVMREERPDLFHHSLQMTLVSLFLGIKSGMGERECVPLAAAAMLHDLGVLHMAPQWRDRKNKVTGAERKHLAAHPITAMLMVREAKVYTPAVEAAVLEHHERLDGTGYPRGLVGDQISPLGRILMLAEVVTAFYEKSTDLPAQQLSLALRLNHRKFPAALVAHILPLLQDGPAHDASAELPVGEQVGTMAGALVESFKRWEQVRAQVPAEALLTEGALGFVETRLRALQKALAEAGAHPDQQADLIAQLQDDAAGLAEVAFVIREALWQLENIVNGCHRRWPGVLERQEPSDRLVGDWCDAVRALMPVVVAQS